MHALHQQHGIGEDGRALLGGLLALHDAPDLRGFADRLPAVLGELIPFDSVALVGELGDGPAGGGVPQAHRLAIRTPGAGRTLLGAVLGRGRPFTAYEAALAAVIGPQLGAAADHVRLRERDRRLALGPDLGVLTRREQQVLARIAEGRTDRDIADLLHIGSRTVEKHVEHIRSKLGARSRAEAVARWALAPR